MRARCQLVPGTLLFDPPGPRLARGVTYTQPDRHRLFRFLATFLNNDPRKNFIVFGLISVKIVGSDAA